MFSHTDNFFTPSFWVNAAPCARAVRADPVNGANPLLREHRAASSTDSLNATKGVGKSPFSLIG